MIRDLTAGSETAFTMPLRHPRWSPDGRFVVGTDSSRGSDEIFICPVDGSACRNLTKGFLPRWFDDRVYFARDSKLDAAEGISTTSPQGGEEKKLADLQGLHPIGQFFDVSSSGKIVWIKYQQGRNELWLSSLE